MFKYCFSVFLALAIGGSMLAQTSLNELESQLKEIRKLDDIHEKKYQLSLLVEPVKELLSHQYEDFSLSDTCCIKYTRSSDTKYQVYYYNTVIDEYENQLDWYVVFGSIKNRQVVHYKESIALKQFKHSHLDNPFQLEITKLDKGDVNIYPLTITHTSNKHIYKQYVDVGVICLFENMLTLTTDKERLDANKQILSVMKVLWQEKQYFAHPFSGLKRVSTLISDDDKVKICTWNILLNDATNRFYGAVVLNNEGQIVVQEFQDKSATIRNPERALLSPKKWWGAVYYDLVTVKEKPENYYLLMGYKPNDEMTKMKVIDVLMLNGGAQVRMGKSVFQGERSLDKRLLFEYSASTNMMLRYEKDEKRIVLDHLAPPNKIYKGNYRFYGPDFSYDAYVKEKGRWVINKDIDLRNETEE